MPPYLDCNEGSRSPGMSKNLTFVNHFQSDMRPHEDSPVAAQSPMLPPSSYAPPTHAARRPGGLMGLPLLPPVDPRFVLRTQALQDSMRIPRPPIPRTFEEMVEHNLRYLNGDPGYDWIDVFAIFSPSEWAKSYPEAPALPPRTLLPSPIRNLVPRECGVYHKHIDCISNHLLKADDIIPSGPAAARWVPVSSRRSRKTRRSRHSSSSKKSSRLGVSHIFNLSVSKVSTSRSICFSVSI